jgi:small subunit ribosomal protein S4e
MTKNSKHMKRYAAPRTWAIGRKELVWAPKPSPGTHKEESALPLVIALRDILKIGQTASEIKKILSERSVLVDGTPRLDHRFPVGIMDVISIPKIGKSFRVMLNPRGQLVLRPIEQTEVGWKLTRIMDKTTVKGGKTQLNLHDGRNILVEKDEFKTGDVIKISLPEQKILGRMELSEDSLALLTGGAHIGTICRIKKIERTENPTANLVEFHEGFNTIIDYVFVVGKETSEITGAEVVL